MASDLLKAPQLLCEGGIGSPASQSRVPSMSAPMAAPDLTWEAELILLPCIEPAWTSPARPGAPPNCFLLILHLPFAHEIVLLPLGNTQVQGSYLGNKDEEYHQSNSSYRPSLSQHSCFDLCTLG